VYFGGGYTSVLLYFWDKNLRDRFCPSKHLKKRWVQQGRKDEAFCDRHFALYIQQRGKDKQNVDVASPWKNCLRTPMAVASFHNSSAQLLKPVCCSNFSKLSVVVSSYKSTCPVCAWWAFTVKKLVKTNKVYWSLWSRSQTFAALVSKWRWQVLLADTTTSGRATGQLSPESFKNMFSC